MAAIALLVGVGLAEYLTGCVFKRIPIPIAEMNNDRLCLRVSTLKEI
jgi:hypothetical protein